MVVWCLSIFRGESLNKNSLSAGTGAWTGVLPCTHKPSMRYNPIQYNTEEVCPYGPTWIIHSGFQNLVLSNYENVSSSSISDDVFYSSSRPKIQDSFFPIFSIVLKCTKLAKIWTQVALGNSPSHVCVLVEKKLWKVIKIKFLNGPYKNHMPLFIKKSYICSFTPKMANLHKNLYC